MDVIFHSHNAVISERLRSRAESIIHKLETRAARPVRAVVRFEQDGPTRRVEIVMHASRRRPLISNGYARTYGPALSEAVHNLQAQLARSKRTRKARTRIASRS
ncbi:MAG TPA: HPF/RaiA family ribosome-associated protein [Gemmatimonadaceae bacterium]|nr:HPF/RaiA family ribosome-associated protein [Gemmatimonadaceae bacterium]